MEKAIQIFSEYFNTDKVTILLRLHPNVSMLFENQAFPNFVRNASHLPDMQELLFVSNVLITDYSDVQFYFMMMRKPVFLFVPDLELYIANEQGLYHDLIGLPFPLAKNNDELGKNIRFFDDKKYQDTITNFMQEQGYILDGQSSKVVFELIQKYSEGRNNTKCIL
jgi:CDP-glycerol glycerophosphotransferase